MRRRSMTAESDCARKTPDVSGGHLGPTATDSSTSANDRQDNLYSSNGACSGASVRQLHLRCQTTLCTGDTQTSYVRFL